MKVLRVVLAIVLVIIITVVLTIVTQVGGVIYLLTLLAYPFINKRFTRWWSRVSLKLLAFVVLYLITTFFIVPPIARLFGRVPLPLIEHQSVRPSILFTPLANRNYVRPALRAVVYDAADQLNKKYPGSKVNYLDANFPFFDGFRLWPHLSHSDGRKLDLSFQYDDSKTHLATTDVPSIIGYGVCEEPIQGEENMPLTCSMKGYWQYSLLTYVASQKNKQDFVVNELRTRTLIEAIARNEEIVKIYIEPHLKTRWKIKTKKISFHGCQAVRHDDHVHVQIRS